MRRDHRIAREVRMLGDDTSLAGVVVDFNAGSNAAAEGVRATIVGPPDTPYSEGHFDLEITFPPTYPFVPPRVVFATPVFHPNVDPVHGTICLDVLKADWSPALTVTTVLLSVVALLGDPNPDDPLSQEVARILDDDPDGFRDTARLWTERHAAPRPAPSPGSSSGSSSGSSPGPSPGPSSGPRTVSGTLSGTGSGTLSRTGSIPGSRTMPRPVPRAMPRPVPSPAPSPAPSPVSRPVPRRPARPAYPAPRRPEGL